ncbi:MAG: type II toxin-antitoxin system PemK/MazF family toxin [Deltaproteobacteria bacterium]|nr:type II toxin-antitoxin system PemK/MazF family toxin [Deltaproteobacteria bacterium]
MNRRAARRISLLGTIESNHPNGWCRRRARCCGRSSRGRHCLVRCRCAWGREPVPIHVPVLKSSSLTGIVMVEQVKSIDFRARRAKRIERAPDEFLSDVLAILDACIY